MEAGAVIEEVWLRPLVEQFYSRVRNDSLLGPVFEEAVGDWADHHRRLIDSWSSVMLTTGRYKGNPVALHMRHAEIMTPERFTRWLDLWGETSREMLPAPAAAAVQAKAARIAESLLLAVRYRRTVAA